MHLLLKDADRMGVIATCPSLTLASCTLPSVPGTGEEKAPDAQAASSEEAPLPGLFGDNDDWDQLLSGIGSTRSPSPYRGGGSEWVAGPRLPLQTWRS